MTVLNNKLPWQTIKKNLFGGWFDSCCTVLIVAILFITLPPILHWAIIDAHWLGSSRAACQGDGACWVFIRLRFQQFMFGFYPTESLWRIYTTLALTLALGMAFILLPRQRMRLTVFTCFIFPWIAFVLLYGGLLGLSRIETSQWGGLFLTIVIAGTGIIAAFPLGVLLALGKRSHIPVLRILCISFIEIIRGVPLISILFMASVMFPLFVPEQLHTDKLLRAIVGIIIFQAAYLAEVVRGGLEVISKGQYEAATTLGLNYWQSMGRVILPQALKIVIPGIVNTQIALFKDTSLVLIIGLFDFLGIVQAATTDPEWVGLSLEGYLFCALIYWMFCWGMSNYSQSLERKLSVVGEHKL